MHSSIYEVQESFMTPGRLLLLNSQIFCGVDTATLNKVLISGNQRFFTCALLCKAAVRL